MMPQVALSSHPQAAMPIHSLSEGYRQLETNVYSLGGSLLSSATYAGDEITVSLDGFAPGVNI